MATSTEDSCIVPKDDILSWDFDEIHHLLEEEAITNDDVRMVCDDVSITISFLIN